MLLRRGSELCFFHMQEAMHRKQSRRLPLSKNRHREPSNPVHVAKLELLLPFTVQLGTVKSRSSDRQMSAVSFDVPYVLRSLLKD